MDGEIRTESPSSLLEPERQSLFMMLILRVDFDPVVGVRLSEPYFDPLMDEVFALKGSSIWLRAPLRTNGGEYLNEVRGMVWIRIVWHIVSGETGGKRGLTAQWFLENIPSPAAWSGP
jgi:hypothetical protein